MNSSIATINGATLLAEQCADWCGPRWPWFPLIPFVFFAFWITLWVTIGRRGRRHDQRWSGGAVLAERYARGEIDEAEYERRREVLRRR